MFHVSWYPKRNELPPSGANSAVQCDNIYVILWLKFSNYNQTKALNQTLPKIYIRWSKWNGKRRYDRKHKKTLNSLNCTSVFLDTSTIQKNTSIIHGLPQIWSPKTKKAKSGVKGIIAPPVLLLLLLTLSLSYN